MWRSPVLALVLVALPGAAAARPSAILAPGTSAAGEFLPLESITWRVDVTGPMVRIEVVERFRNPSDEPVDALYVFPLGPGTAIDGMHLRIGTREIDGVIQPRDQARAAYEAARDAGEVAALTEELRDDVFTQDVANLPPGAAIEVTLSVVQPVRREGDSWGLTLPLVSPPRFLPIGTDPTLPALLDAGPRDTGVRATVELSVQAGNAVRELWAAPLPSDVRPDLFGSAARLSLDGLPFTDDLTIGWTTTQARVSAGLVISETHVLLVTEPGSEQFLGAVDVDWSNCPVVDEVQVPTNSNVRYVLARRVGECRGSVVVHSQERYHDDLRTYPRPAVDERTLATSWARTMVDQGYANSSDWIRAMGLEYGIVTSETSFVALERGSVAAIEATEAQQGPALELALPDFRAGGVEGGVLGGVVNGVMASPVVAYEPEAPKQKSRERRDDGDFADHGAREVQELSVMEEEPRPAGTEDEALFDDAARFQRQADGAADPLEARRNLDRAVRLYERLLERFPDSPRLDEALFQLATVLEALGRHAEATARFSELAARFPDSAWAARIPW